MRTHPASCIAAVLVLVLGLATAARAQLGVDASTLALWHLDDGSGLVASDSSSGNRDLQLQRDPSDGSLGSLVPTFASTGCFGDGLFFRQGSSVDDGGYGLASQSFPFAQNQLTVELWMRTQRASGYLLFAGFLQLEMWIDFTGKVGFDVGDGQSWGPDVFSSAALTDGAWHYLAATYDGANERLFVDGQQEGIAAFTGSVGTANGFYLGGRPSDTFFDGFLDEVRVSDVARSSAAIAATESALTCPEPGTTAVDAAAALALAGLVRARSQRGSGRQHHRTAPI